MLHNTRGIVLKITNYSETSLVAQIYTEKFGLQSYLINGVRKAKPNISRGVLQGLNQLQLIVYHKPTGNLQRIKEIQNQPAYKYIPFNPIKSAILIFINEVLYKILRQQESDERLFEFICQSISIFDLNEENPANFHLVFLMQLSRYLGFYPDTANADTSTYFDLKEGAFTNYRPLHPLYIDEKLTVKFLELLRTNFENCHSLSLSATNRRELLQLILQYYTLHVDGMSGIQSHEILEEVLHN